jgi:hypothetical protein
VGGHELSWSASTHLPRSASSIYPPARPQPRVEVEHVEAGEKDRTAPRHEVGVSICMLCTGPRRATTVEAAGLFLCGAAAPRFGGGAPSLAKMDIALSFGMKIYE